MLDGGMGHLLKRPGAPSILASCLACSDRPQAVVDAHRAYALAGASVLTTNNFACTPYAFAKRSEPRAYLAVVDVRFGAPCALHGACVA